MYTIIFFYFYHLSSRKIVKNILLNSIGIILFYNIYFICNFWTTQMWMLKAHNNLLHKLLKHVIFFIFFIFFVIELVEAF